MEQLWEDNHLTIEGKIQHKHVDDAAYRQKCGDFISLCAVHVASHELGLYGITDVVELHPSDDERNSITHPKYPGRWYPYPIEYKHGHPKKDELDEVQLTAQIMCIEEQYGIDIDCGALFYHESRHREEVVISSHLRNAVRSCAQQMHEIYESRLLPAIVKGRKCPKCSLNNICMPEIADCSSASNYLKRNLYEETP